MSELLAIVWDMDGTLADTECDGHRVAFNKAFEQADLKERWSIEHYGKLLDIAGGKERIRSEVQCGKLPPLSDEEIRNLHQTKTKFYGTLIEEGTIPLRPGVRRLLEEGHQEQLKLGIATTSTPDAMNALLKFLLGTEWSPRFGVRAAGDIIAHKKPAPDIYNYALEHLETPAKHAVAIEDSVHGLHAAKAAGMYCVVTVNAYTRNQNFDGADLVVSELGEPDTPACEVLSNPHGLSDLHHVTLQHLKQIVSSK